jgi:hypothetical protein
MDSQSITQPARSKKLISIMDKENIDKDRVAPVISNSFYINEVLRNERKLTVPAPDNADDLDRDFTPDERLTKLWSMSEDVNYPMADGHDLARVAQYYQLGEDVIEFPSTAKKAYLKFRNSRLLEINETEKPNEVAKLNVNGPFSEIVTRLYTEALGTNDPLDKLANIPFSNYITTSYHDFLERALINAQRTPITQFLCLEDGGQITTWELNDKGEIVPPNPTRKGTKLEPVIFHLFGVEKDPKSLIISEDDYINFLVTAVTDTDKQHPMIPLQLQTILSASYLLLLGYQLQDWEFRALFRLILHKRASSLPKPGIFMQIPRNRDMESLLKYLVRYFGPRKFEVERKSPAEFAQTLWELWEGQ